MRTEKNSREARATEAASRASFRQRPRSGAGLGGSVRRLAPTTCATSAPGAGALRITAAVAVSRRSLDEPGRFHRPGAAFRRLSPFGDPHPARRDPRAPAPKVDLRFTLVRGKSGSLDVIRRIGKVDGLIGGPRSGAWRGFLPMMEGEYFERCEAAHPRPDSKRRRRRRRTGHGGRQ